MADTFEFEIVTPQKLVVRDVADEMQIPAKSGYIGVLPGHAPLITELAVGEITYRNDETTGILSVAWGFAEVLPTKVTILAQSAERPEEIDTARAQQAKQRAEERLRGGQSGIDFDRALKSLRRAENRLDVASKAGAK
jgi:F-type H+-transporting ATPase subunit epsilon